MPEPAGAVDAPEALSVREVADRLKYTPRLIRARVAAARFPAPIDPALPARSWRWNSHDIDSYIRGEWTKAA